MTKEKNQKIIRLHVAPSFTQSRSNGIGNPIIGKISGLVNLQLQLINWQFNRTAKTQLRSPSIRCTVTWNMTSDGTSYELYSTIARGFWRNKEIKQGMLRPLRSHYIIELRELFDIRKQKCTSNHTDRRSVCSDVNLPRAPNITIHYTIDFLVESNAHILTTKLLETLRLWKEKFQMTLISVRMSTKRPISYWKREMYFK